MIFGKNILKDFCKLCNISYLPGQDVVESFYCRPFNNNDNCSVFYNCDKPPILYSRGRDSQMYVCDYQNKLTIVFRGTEASRDIFYEEQKREKLRDSVTKQMKEEIEEGLDENIIRHLL